jgi:hypothetical protein
MVGVGEEGDTNRGDARGMSERCHRAGAFGIALVQAVDRLIQCDPQFHLPAHPIQVGDLPWPQPRGQIRQKNVIALRRVDPDAAEMPGMPDAPHRHIGVNGPAVADQDGLLKEGIEVGPREALLPEGAARQMVHFRLPVVLEADDNADPIVVADPQSSQAGIGEVGEQAPPARIHRSSDAGCHAPERG